MSVLYMIMKWMKFPAKTFAGKHCLDPCKAHATPKEKRDSEMVGILPIDGRSFL